MISSRAQAVLVMIGVFVLGAGTGAGFTWAHAERRLARLDEPGPGGRGERHVRALTGVLGLSPEQAQRVREIFERAGPEREERMRDLVMGPCGQGIRDHKSRLDSEIRSLLTPEQQEKFDALAVEQDERFFRRGPRHKRR